MMQLNSSLCLIALASVLVVDVQAADLRQGHELLEEGRTAEAIEYFEIRVDQLEENAEARYWLARSLLAADRPDEARDLFKDLAARDPSNGDLYYWVGRSYIDELQEASFMKQSLLAPRAKANYERAIEIDPDHLGARIGLGQYYLNAPSIAGGSISKAKEQADAAVALAPLEGRLLLAEILREEEEWEHAIDNATALTALEPDNPAHHYRLGRLHQDRQEWGPAFDSFQRSVDVDPDHALSWYQLGRTGALSGEQLGRAQEALEEFIARFGEDEAIHAAYHAGAQWRLGMVLEQQGALPAAAVAYREAIDLAPTPDAVERAEKALAALEPRMAAE